MYELYIKNMVCKRCIMSVEAILQKYGIEYKEVKLGKAVLETKPDENLLKKIEQDLKEIGFELLRDPEKIITEQIKNLIIEYIHNDDFEKPKVKLSVYLSQNLNKSYSVLSEIFKKHQNTTIEKYFIRQRIERVKELISYGELTFSEIAYKLGYSSVAHLSRQFKQVTGLTLSQFKQKAMDLRKSLDEV